MLRGGGFLLHRELRLFLRFSVLHSLHRLGFPCDPRYIVYVFVRA